MKRQYLSREHNTSEVGTEPTHITITHPHHPLNGQTLELVGVLRGPNSRLVVKMPDGSHVRVVRDWTDYARVSGDSELPAASHLLPVEGLRELIKIIAQVD
jgi:hypothetical protein